eukprot:COSAG04_NODE_7660_length_1090_cov_1.446014_1_plen_29_part_10
MDGGAMMFLPFQHEAVATSLCAIVPTVRP